MNNDVLYDSGYGNDWDLLYYGGDSNNNQNGLDWMDETEKVESKMSCSYSKLIALAIIHSDSGEIPVSDIYTYICEHFPYFRTAPPGWKNSVRHNLSHNKNFVKVRNELMKLRSKIADQNVARDIKEEVEKEEEEEDNDSPSLQKKLQESSKLTKSQVKPAYRYTPRDQTEHRRINPAYISH